MNRISFVIKPRRATGYPHRPDVAWPELPTPIRAAAERLLACPKSPIRHARSSVNASQPASDWTTAGPREICAA